MRKARLIYESERASFMADHKSVSAQLTLGNFPTPFSNQTPFLASSQGDPPRALRLPQAGGSRREMGRARDLEGREVKD